MAERKPAAAGGRYPLLDSLRAIATMSVFVNHMSFKVGPPSGDPNNFSFAAYVTQQNTRIFAPAIAVFFVLSGFLLYLPFARARYLGRPAPAVRPYLVRRFLRIVPAYWVALPIVALMLSRSEVFTPSGIVTYFGFLQIYTNGTFNGGIAQAWTLDVDVPFYLLLPLLALFLARRPVKDRRSFLRSELLVLGSVVVASMIWQAMVFKQRVPQPLFLFPGLLSFPGSADLLAIGMMLAVVTVALGEDWPRWLKDLLTRRPWVPWLLAGFVLFWIPHINVRLEKDYGILNWWVTHLLKAAFAILLMLPAIVGRENRDVMRRALGSRLVRYLSDRSYAFYLWHLAMIDVIADAGLRGSIGALGLILVCLAAAMTAAELSWRIVEKPTIALGARWTRGRPRDAKVAVEAPPP
jgi:peptidoglycan/LPS O-acetylase OafA/YrhL